MAERKVLNIIRYFEERLNESGMNVQKIILFGSSARGTAGEDSDIDIAVISTDFRGKNIFKRAPLIKYAEVSTIRKFLVPLDVITMSPEDLESETSPIAGYVRQGKVVYPAQKRNGLRKKAAAGR